MKTKLSDVKPDYDSEKWGKAIDSWVFNEFDRVLLKRHYLDGKSYYDLADEYHFDYDTIKKRIKTAREVLFLKLKEVCASYIKRIQMLADRISEIDCLVAFSNLALKYNYVRPTFSINQDVIIIDGRHPVVENVLGTDYVVNDVIVNVG